MPDSKLFNENEKFQLIEDYFVSNDLSRKNLNKTLPKETIMFVFDKNRRNSIVSDALNSNYAGYQWEKMSKREQNEIIRNIGKSYDDFDPNYHDFSDKILDLIFEHLKRNKLINLTYDKMIKLKIFK